ncbi:winged helix-turn-helix domain-containing protein [Novosphingobium sp. KACC 22771]|uniref:winged helix-turn-helix domain-containing protein n=1 Tax=Novosphingobium sp. KACC 22771 TaxID=3025670 RepID=UPI002366DC0C|nr:winged helix-turn-helix domain-containing protein [Novosphingobium sp. KACC 22771]WDF74651.1 winged helix-turn-helix domain-containing protein [Novosphingobium sp. KACC 22771]
MNKPSAISKMDSEVSCFDPEAYGVMASSVPGLGLSDIVFRVISLQDNGRDERLEWLKQGISQWQDYAYREGETNFLSVVERDYDVMIVAGNDVQRMKRIITRNRVALHRKLKICVMNQSLPADRAQLLMAGFDDVIDTGRIAWPEFAARMCSMHLRMMISIGRYDAKELEIIQLSQICNPRRLTRREQDLLLGLMQARDMTASTMALRCSISLAHSMVSELHLRVLISQLRRKLFDHVEINNVRGAGYQLVIHPRLASAAE